MVVALHTQLQNAEAAHEEKVVFLQVVGATTPPDRSREMLAESAGHSCLSRVDQLSASRVLD